MGLTASIINLLSGARSISLAVQERSVLNSLAFLNHDQPALCLLAEESLVRSKVCIGPVPAGAAH